MNPRDTFLAGVWQQNPALLQLLGLCPLMAVTTTAVNGVALGVGTLVVITLSNGLVSLLRHWLNGPLRLPAFVLIIAALVTALDLLMSAFFHPLYRVLGLFVPLIVTNCAILGRAEAFASRNGLLPSLVDGFGNGLGFLLVLVILGASRELVGRGTLLSDMHLLFGPNAPGGIALADGGLLVMILPPGAFIVFGILVALYNRLRNSGGDNHQ